MRRFGFTLSVAVSLGLFAPIALAIPVARLQLQSDPGDYVGGGQSYDITYEDTDGIGAQIYRYVDSNLSLPPYGLYLSIYNVSPVLFTNWAFMRFETSRAGVALRPGVYANAVDQKDQFPGQPGMLIGFQHRGTSNITGQFTIFEIAFSSDYSRLLTLVIEFEQHDGGPTAPGLRGRLEYRSDGLTIIPEPSTALLVTIGLAGLAWRRGEGRARSRRYAGERAAIGRWEPR